MTPTHTTDNAFVYEYLLQNVRGVEKAPTYTFNKIYCVFSILS